MKVHDCAYFRGSGKRLDPTSSTLPSETCKEPKKPDEIRSLGFRVSGFGFSTDTLKAPTTRLTSAKPFRSGLGFRVWGNPVQHKQKLRQAGGRLRCRAPSSRADCCPCNTSHWGKSLGMDGFQGVGI